MLSDYGNKWFRNGRENVYKCVYGHKLMLLENYWYVELRSKDIKYDIWTLLKKNPPILMTIKEIQA